MDKVRVSVVAYLNSQPFIYGLESLLLDDIILTKDVPSECAIKVITGEVSLGLVPVAALPLIKEVSIISEYCLAADGPVNSVFLFSNKPLKEIKTICLDEQSMTSNNLTKILATNYWKLDVTYVTDSASADALVRIGDRTYDKIKAFKYAYDLSEQWKNYTGLPFVFAVWASNKKLPNQFIEKFNVALQWGLDHRKELIKKLKPVDNFDTHDYLFNKMSYHFDEPRRKAMNLFLEETRILELTQMTP